MTRELYRFLKNAISNVLRGASGTVAAIVLPPFLSRSMGQEVFGAWSLVLQIAAFVNYLDFGVQTAVGRYIARFNECADADGRDEVINTSVAALCASSVVATLALAFTAIALPQFFPQMSPGLYGGARAALLIVGGSLSIGLPASVANGVFVGIQRNEIPATTTGLGRLLSVVLLIIAAHFGVGLVGLACILAATNLLSYAAQVAACFYLVPGVRLSHSRVTRAMGWELAKYCGSLTIWMSSMLVITGLDLTIVAHFQFDSVACYAVAAGAVTVIVGVTNAIFSTLLSPAAVLQARSHARELGTLVTVASRYGMYALLFVGIPLVFFAPEILMLWMGPSYVLRATPLLRWLVVANVIRLALTPYSVAVLAVGQQRLALSSPILEAVTNLACSIVAAHLLGAVGVAIGTFIGAIVGMSVHLVRNMPRTVDIQLSVDQYIKQALALPAACCLPLMLAALAFVSLSAPVMARVAMLVCGACSTAACIWRWGLDGGEKHRLREMTLGLV